jgi:hypothetical protein
MGMSANWRGGLLDADAWRLSPSLYRFDATNRFNATDHLGAHLDLRTDSGFSFDRYGLNGRFGLGEGTLLNADWLRTREGQIYGADGAFKLGRDGNGTAEFRVDEPAGTAMFNTKLKFDDFSHLNADWLRTREGQIYGADGAFKLGRDGNGTAEFRVDEPAGTAMFNTKLKFDDFSHLNADWLRTREGQIYGADGAFKLGRDGNGTAAFRVDEPAGTEMFNTKLKFDDFSHLNADWLRTREGQIYGADGAFKLGKDGNGTAEFRVDELAGTAMFNTKLKFDDFNHLNADWLRTREGQIYGADGAFKLGKDGNGTAAFRVDEPAGTAMFNTKLKFDDFSHLNADWLRTREGQIYGADGAFKLGKDGNGTAAFRVDEPAGTSMFNTKLRFAEGYGLNADYTGSRLGAIYGADTEFKLGKDGQGTGAFRVDEPAGTSSMNARLRFGNGDNLKFDLDKGREGAVIGAEGAFGLGRDIRGQFGVRIDQPAGSAEYRLGAEFANGDRLRAALGTGPQGTSVNLGANLAFARDAGSLALDGTFGPKLDFGAAVDYRNPHMALGGKVRFDNSSGPLRMSEFGATFRTVDNPRHQFSLEAGYRPEARDAFVKVGWTFTFGGGSRPSKPVEAVREPPLPDAVAPRITSARPALAPGEQALHEAAQAGVRRLNAGGAGLPVDETAASLAVLAKQQGLRGIGYVELGSPTPNGRQNLFIGEGDPGDPAGRRAFIDRAQAAGTPVQDSLSRLAVHDGAQTQDIGAQSKRPTMP